MLEGQGYFPKGGGPERGLPGCLGAAWVLFSLPHSSQKIHEALGGAGVIAPLPRLEEVDDLDKTGFRYPIITGSYVLGETVAPWRREDIVPGTPIAKPTPVFAKIPREAVQKEIDRFKTDLRKKEAERTSKAACGARTDGSAASSDED